jgi:plasmid stability protein
MTKANLTFRVPESLRARLESAAAANGRSMNAEMIFRIESSFEAATVVEIVRAFLKSYVHVPPQLEGFVSPGNLLAKYHRYDGTSR